MPRYVFDSQDIKKSIALARIVKPENGDLRFRFRGRRFIISSWDKRKIALISPHSISSDADEDFSSDEFVLSLDRLSILDSDWPQIKMSVNDGSINVTTEDGSQSKKASIKRKPRNRPPTIPILPSEPEVSIPSKALDRILRGATCSSLSKETKTEEDMRVNQVHFFSSNSCVLSHARFFATTVYFAGLKTDISLVSSDISIVRAFCAKTPGNVLIYQDSSHLYFSNEIRNNFIAFSRVACKRPPLESLDQDKYTHIVAIELSKLKKSIDWSMASMEGTSRLTMHVKPGEDQSCMINFRSPHDDLVTIEAKLKKGNGFSADFHVKFLAAIVNYLDQDFVTLRYCHELSPTMLELSQEEVFDDTTSLIQMNHVMQSMKEKS